MVKKLSKSIGVIIAISIVSLGVLYFAIFYGFKHTIWSDYRHAHWGGPSRDFIVQAFKSIPQTAKDQTALDLSADIKPYDMELAVAKGCKVIAVDNASTQFPLLNEHGPVRYISREEVDFAKLPDFDLVIASFIIPFYSNFETMWPGYSGFTNMWADIVRKIKPGAYFIGNFMDPDNTIFVGQDREKLTFHTKEQVLALFKDFKILKLQEIKAISTDAKELDHYYEVFAQKVK